MSRRSPCSKGLRHRPAPCSSRELPYVSREPAHLALPPADSLEKPTLRPEPDEGFVDLKEAFRARSPACHRD
jgi:hypothetical protein